MSRKWIYEGNIRSYSCKMNYRKEYIIDEIELYDPADNRKAPILLHVSPALFAYIMDLEDNDDEERYMRKEFTYDDILCIRKIRILNKDGLCCKVISEHDEASWTAQITGPMARINNRNQKALGWNDEVHLVGPDSFKK